eukprot:7576126-Pyramimonas_sp.AAC.1
MHTTTRMLGEAGQYYNISMKVTAPLDVDGLLATPSQSVRRYQGPKVRGELRLGPCNVERRSLEFAARAMEFTARAVDFTASAMDCAAGAVEITDSCRCREVRLTARCCRLGRLNKRGELN